jgi:hypothetical protein
MELLLLYIKHQKRPCVLKSNRRPEKLPEEHVQLGDYPK